VELLQREFTSLFNRAFPTWPVPFEPPYELMEPWGIEVEEKVQEVIFRVELPGFEVGEIEVQLVGNCLKIVAEHKVVPPPKENVPFEKPYGKFEEMLTLPEGIVPEKIEAIYRNGVLEVHIPKPPAAQPKPIVVKT
jgi:HSP20 family protein